LIQSFSTALAATPVVNAERMIGDAA